jgi:hypothetical protein
MNLSEQVCSLELSKKLKELGVKQDSLFYYASYSIHENELASNELIFFIDNKRNVISSGFSWFCDDESPIDQKYSAFTASELLELLPTEISYQQISHYLSIISRGNYYNVHYRQFANDQFIPVSLSDETLTNTLAQTLIFLIEKGLIKNES